jgi:hypothetical protein
MEFADHAVLEGPQFLQVDRRVAETDAVRRHGGRLVDDPGGVQQGLGRNAADIEANAAQHRVTLDQGDPQPEVGGAKGGGVPARARAQHDNVELVAGPGLRGAAGVPCY